MKPIYLFLLSIAVLATSSCEDGNSIFKKKSTVLQQKLNANTVVDYNTTKDLSYGPDGFHKYDLYTPNFDPNQDSVAKSIALVMVHGGGWSLLDKQYLQGAVEEFKKQHINVTIFNINHRLANGSSVLLPQIMEDFDQFFDHLETQKSVLNLDKEVLLWGYSSGGHLALTYAYSNTNRNIAQVTALVAPTDLTDKNLREALIDEKFGDLTQRLVGVSYEENPEAYKKASPLYINSKSSIPTLLYYGGNDSLVNQVQGEKLRKELKRKNVNVTLEVYPQATHEMEEQIPKIITGTSAFLNKI